MNLNGRLSYEGNVSGSLGADLVADVEANPSGPATQTLVKIRVGDIIYSIPTGGGGGGVTSYSLLTDKPKINNHTIDGDMTSADLDLQDKIVFPEDGNKYLDGNGNFTTPAIPLEHYSTNEQVVGTWIDNKPLYQKTIEFSNFSKSGTLSFGITDVENIFLISGMVSDSLPLPYVHGAAPSNNVGGFFSITQSDIGWSFRCGNDAPSTLSGWITVAYTKTTD